MAIVRFPEHRHHDAVRIEVNNAMMGLLAGAQLAVHTLKLTEGSEQLLPKMFPAVAHIARFNITTSAANEILIEADKHLGAMAVLYVLSIHEDYLKTCLAFFPRAGLASRNTVRETGLLSGHEWIEKRSKRRLPADTLKQFHILRQMRNCLVHRGGRANPDLINEAASMSPNAESNWKKVVGRSPRGLSVSDRIDLSYGEIIMTLAVTKRLAKELNEMLQSALPATAWADILIEDLVEYGPGLPSAKDHPSAEADRVRKATGYARYHYDALGLSEQDIRQAIERYLAASR